MCIESWHILLGRSKILITTTESWIRYLTLCGTRFDTVAHCFSLCQMINSLLRLEIYWKINEMRIELCVTFLNYQYDTFVYKEHTGQYGFAFTKLGWHSWRIRWIIHTHYRRPVCSTKQRRFFILCSSINKAGLLQNEVLTSLMKSAYFSPSMAINLFNTVLCQGGVEAFTASRHQSAYYTLSGQYFVGKISLMNDI